MIDGEHARHAAIEAAREVGDLVRIASGLSGSETVVIGEGPEREGQRLVRK